MLYLQFKEADQDGYPIVILSPKLDKLPMVNEYIRPFGLPQEAFLGMSLHTEGKKTSVKRMREFVRDELTDALLDYKPDYIVCADAGYFKILTDSKSADSQVGYVTPCTIEGVTANVVYVPNFRGIFYDPVKLRGKIATSMNALVAHAQGNYQPPGSSIIHSVAYPKTTDEIREALLKLLEMDCDLASDIEAFSLKHYSAGIGTITFCWDEHNGIAFPVDYMPIPDATEAPYGIIVKNDDVRAMLKEFFIELKRRKRKVIWHNISYDVYVLIFQLFMDDLIDQVGLLEGLECMLGYWDDTKLIAYLATNSCAGNELGLKILAQEFAGDWACDNITNILNIPLDKLLQYNVVDGLSNWYVHNKYKPLMIQDQQEDLYENHFKAWIVDIIQMQLTGMPLNIKTVRKVKKDLEQDRDQAIATMRSSQLVQEYEHIRVQNWVADRNNKLKVKRVTAADCKDSDKAFNPNSPNQLQYLLYEQLGLPVLNLTKSKQPATDKKTLKALKAHTKRADITVLIDALIDFTDVEKILTAFIPHMENAIEGPDGWHYMFGNFNLGGTVSGRLSSSGPNLQNLPASRSKYAKPIKKCFEAPPGWLFCGLDFASLEDRISALTTRDPNKVKVYSEGFDGHSLRAYGYFHDEMPDIRQASDNDRAYRAKVGDTDICFLGSDVITYCGKKYTGDELYDLLSNS